MIVKIRFALSGRGQSIEDMERSRRNLLVHMSQKDGMAELTRQQGEMRSVRSVALHIAMYMEPTGQLLDDQRQASNNTLTRLGRVGCGNGISESRSGGGDNVERR